MEIMNNYYSEGFEPDLPTAAGQVDFTDLLKNSLYYKTYIEVREKRRTPTPSEQPKAEEPKPEEKVVPVRRLFPMLMIFIFSLAVLAIAAAGALKIAAVAEYTVLSGNAAYADILVLIDCLTKATAPSIEGIFQYVLPIALFLSIAIALLTLILSFAAMCMPKSRIGLTGLSLIAFLLAVLAAVALYIVTGAPALIDEFFAFGGDKAIGYGFVGILGLELLAFIFSLFANKPAKKA